MKVHTEPCTTLQLTAGYQTCQTHRSAELSWCWPTLDSKGHFCQKLVFAINTIIPLKRITRSRIRKDTGDAWSAIWQLPWDSVPFSAKASWNSTGLVFYWAEQNKRPQENYKDKTMSSRTVNRYYYNLYFNQYIHIVTTKGRVQLKLLVVFTSKARSPPPPLVRP